MGLQQMSGRTRMLVFGVMALGMFMSLLDVQIVAASLPEVEAGLSAGADEGSWVQTSYLIAEIVMIPLSGFLSRAFSTRWLFTASAAAFTVSSIACGFAWNLPVMIAFRAVQGFVGGAMIPTVFATGFVLFQGKKQALIPAILGIVATMAPTLGPTLGGWITDRLSWHWLFLLNLAPGVVCTAAVLAWLDIDKPQPELFKRFDWWSLLFMSMFLGGLEYTLDDGPRHDWFSQDSVIVCALMATVGGVLFFWRSFAAEHPLIDLRVFRDRNFAVTSLVSTIIGMSMFTLIYLTPVFLGQVAGYNPLQIGHVMMIQGGTMFLCAPVAGRLQLSMDPRHVIAIGLGLIFSGTWLNSHLTSDWGYAQFVLPQALRGAGFCFSFIPLTGLALGTLPMQQVHNASGLFNVTRNIGGALGLAVVNTLINQRTWLHWQQLAESARLSRAPVREALSGMQGMLRPELGGASQAGSISMLAQMVELQTATLTYGDMYRLIACSLLLSMPMILLLRKPRPAPAAAGGH